MQTLTDYLPLYGKWTKENDSIVFTRATSATGGPTLFGYDSEAGRLNSGLALFGYDMEDGEIEAEINLSSDPPGGEDSLASAMIVFRANGQKRYYAAGVGGGLGNAYSLQECEHQRVPMGLAWAGSSTNIEPGRTYKVKIVLEGQKVDIYVDSIKVISYSNLPRQTGTNIGLCCSYATPKAIFSNFRVSSSKPKAFVAMQFSEPYNEVYRDAVEPLVQEIGFEPIRVDDVYGPGIIINDIINNLSEASIVLAEISEKNANVYYELGLAHAFGKPTLLMATKGTSLPFDVGGHRCIFYENTIAGRGKLQASLKHSLMSLLGRSI